MVSLFSASLAMAAQTFVVNNSGSAPGEFGAAALRDAAARTPLGRVVISIDPRLKPEAFRIRNTGEGWIVTGGDQRGAMYGALDAAEQLELSGGLHEKEEQPTLSVRALKYNIPLPGTGYLSEEDLAHNQWFWSLEYWRAFLDMAARNRYNAITFWSAHPFDRMVRNTKYPEASGLPEAELNQNIAFFRQLFQMAADRGIDTYLITWNIHVSRAFAARHNIPDSAFDSPLVRDYQREAIKALFATYPMLTGLGTTAGERMGAMTTRQKLDWIADTYFAALRQVGRPAPPPFILRYWQSQPEETAAMLASVKYPGPVYLDIKFNGEHMYSSTKPHVQDRKWMDMARGRYRLLWHLRNDDIFILRWGDPDFVRETVHSMSGPDSAGFVEGSELDIPGIDRIHTAAAGKHMDWQYKFEKHWFRYMLWGRLGYFASEPDDMWRAHFRRRFGPAGDDTFEAIHQAGKIVPLVTSYHWNYMNGDWYPEGSIGTWNTSYEQPRANYRRATMYHDIRTYIFNNTIDEEFASIPDFLAGSKATGPLEVAARLETFGHRALESIGRARTRVERGQKEFECTQADMLAYGQLGIYYGEKLEAAAHLARFLFGAGEAERREAITHLERALEAWRGVVAATENHYVTHEVWLFGQFDWKRYLADVEGDIRIAEEATPFRQDSTYSLEGLHAWLEYTGARLGRRSGEAAGAEPVPLRIEAESAQPVTPPMSIAGDTAASGGKYVVVAAQATSQARESITGFREFISDAASARYSIDLPADGEYALWVRCSWPQRSGTLSVLVDESNTRSYSLRPPASGSPESWAVQKLNATLYLGAGRHTIRLFSRSAGVRIDRFVLAPSRMGAAAAE